MSKKKESETFFFVILSIKLGRFWWNLVHRLPNKFASKWCKRFPPHLNNVSTLPCESWNAHCAHAAVELLQKETPEFIPPQLWPPHLPYVNPVDKQYVGNVAREDVQNTLVMLWFGFIDFDWFRFDFSINNSISIRFQFFYDLHTSVDPTRFVCGRVGMAVLRCWPPTVSSVVRCANQPYFSK